MLDQSSDETDSSFSEVSGINPIARNTKMYAILSHNRGSKFVAEFQSDSSHSSNNGTGDANSSEKDEKRKHFRDKMVR